MQKKSLTKLEILYFFSFHMKIKIKQIVNIDKKKRSLPSKKLFPNALGAKRYMLDPNKAVILLAVLNLIILKREIPLKKNIKKLEKCLK